MQKEKTIFKFISISCISISIISFIGVIFPALIIESSIEIPRENINHFEFGNWAIPFIFSNLIFFSLFILYKLNKIPFLTKEKIHNLSTKDISHKVSFLIILSILSFYVIFSIEELSREEFELGDYAAVINHLENTSIEDYLSTDISSTVSTGIRFTLLKASMILFDNVRVLPFIASISLLVLTYFITLELTKKRIAGIFSVVILIQSNLFLIFDSTSTYENFWTVFYFLSFYLIFKKPIGSHISYIASLFSKTLSITFLPINLFAIFRKDLPLKNKKVLIISYSIIIILFLIWYIQNSISNPNPNFDEQRIILGFNEFGSALRFDGLILLLFFPTLVILMNKKGIVTKNIEIILVGIIFTLISQPLLYYMTPITIMPYRYVPLLVFFAIGVGMLFINSKNTEVT